MSFYVTLPSNASPVVFPNNEAGHFFVKLPQTIDVSSRYEVGLVEIQIPNTYCVLRENEVWLQYYSVRDGVDVNTFLFGIPETSVLNIDLIAKGIKKILLKTEIEAGKVEVITSECNSGLKKIIVKVNEPGIESTIREKIIAYRFGPSKLTEDDIEGEIKTVFVYCDLVASRPVGDVMVPLLRAVPIVEKRSGSVFRIYDKPHYVPLSRFSFDTVEILLCNDLGQTIPFTSGTSVLTLHFRTRKHFDLE